MSDEIFFYIWKDMEFIPVKSPPNDPDIPSLSISLKEQKIRVFFPEHLGLVERRTIKRRLDSIARTGIWSPENPPRKIGARFVVEMVGGEEQLDPSLLIPGHEYGSRTRTPSRTFGSVTDTLSTPTQRTEPTPAPAPEPEPAPEPAPAPEPEPTKKLAEDDIIEENTSETNAKEEEMSNDDNNT